MEYLRSTVIVVVEEKLIEDISGNAIEGAVTTTLFVIPMSAAAVENEDARMGRQVSRQAG